MFFPLDSQGARIFYPKKCLTALMVVTCLTQWWILVQAEARQPTTFLKMVVVQERLYPVIIFLTWLGKYIWAWLVNGDNWARRLGHYTMGFSQPGPVGWRVWVKAHGTHNAPLFPVEEGSLP